MPSLTMPAGGLYAITATDNLTEPEVLAITKILLGAGISLLQYRNKHQDEKSVTRLGKALVELCNKFKVPVIVNDDPALAARTGAAGVHLGNQDADISWTRCRYPDLIIGASCYNDPGLALCAQSQGADYVAFGSFYTSPTKPDAIKVDPDIITRARTAIKLPVVAIGGITPENGGPLLAAGADFLAVISGLYAHPDPCAQAMKYLSLFKKTS